MTLSFNPACFSFAMPASARPLVGRPDRVMRWGHECEAVRQGSHQPRHPCFEKSVQRSLISVALVWTLWRMAETRSSASMVAKALIEFNGEHERLASVPEDFRVVRDKPIPGKESARGGDRLER